MLQEVYLISLHSSIKEYRNIKLFHTFFSLTFNCKFSPPVFSRGRSRWPRGQRVRLHVSQNRHNTANQHLSGHTFPDMCGYF